ncbi:hypothetical protein MJ643_30140 [Pseudomonas sp. PNPG3]|nr:hypothetical protein [Pseudomonas sp. PNPG3]
MTGLARHSKWIVRVQKPLYWRAKSSHVAVVYAENTIIHSVGGSGVNMAEMIEELDSCKADWRVMRLKGLTEHQEEELQKASVYFLRQGYNRAFMMGGNEVSSFCSEFAVKVYKRAGIRIINGKKPSKVAPWDFDKAFDSGKDWSDVTSEYVSDLQEWQKMRGIIQMSMQLQKLQFARRQYFSQQRKQLFSYFEAQGSPHMKEVIAKTKADLREKRVLSFWDEDDWR